MAKLTKRQKKGIAFRERKRGHIKDIPTDDPENDTDVSHLQDPVSVDSAQGLQGHQVGKEIMVGKRKARGKGDEAESQGRVVVAEKKRKKVGENEEAGGESGEPKPKRRKRAAGGVVSGVGEPVGGDGEAGKEPEGEGEDDKTKQRFILFLGNLKYTTTTEAIQAHFSVCVPPPTVRLLTPKPSSKSSTKPVTKSKGCAFLEFTHRGALQQGLRLHHSQLDGRQINVELTAGGGGKGATRLKKLKERNKELEGQRRKRPAPKSDTQPDGSQRFSTTSGIEETPTYKRTWTTGDVEDKNTHRGGQKHKRKKRGSTVKDFRTGVNTIPVG